MYTTKVNLRKNNLSKYFKKPPTTTPTTELTINKQTKHIKILITIKTKHKQSKQFMEKTKPKQTHKAKIIKLK